jgi:hypothetical protein
MKTRKMSEEDERFSEKAVFWCRNDNTYRNRWGCKRRQGLLLDSCSITCNQAVEMDCVLEK